MVDRGTHASEQRRETTAETRRSRA